MNIYPPQAIGTVFVWEGMPTIITQTRNGENPIWICTKCSHHGELALTFDCEFNANQHKMIVHATEVTEGQP